MTCCNRIEAQRIGALGEARKFQFAIAFDAWVWRGSVGMGVDVWLNNLLIEIFAEVENKMVFLLN